MCRILFKNVLQDQLLFIIDRCETQDQGTPDTELVLETETAASLKMEGTAFSESTAFSAASWERKRISPILGQESLLFWISQQQINNWKKKGIDKNNNYLSKTDEKHINLT